MILWSVEKVVYDRQRYVATVDRRYQPGRAGHSVTSVAWLPEVSFARSLAELLGDDGRILTRTEWKARVEQNAAVSN